jgi:hypothetical protein
MENAVTLQQFEIVSDKTVKTDSKDTSVSLLRKLTRHAIGRLIIEGGKDFFHYLKWHDLANDPSILVLSSKNQFYYEHYELRCTRTLVILQKLNLIKHVEVLLQSLHQTLSPNTNFIGYFFDSNTQNGSGLIYRMYKKLINFLDSRTEREFDRESVLRLLESFGFQVIDMTTINGLTYFRTQNI